MMTENTRSCVCVPDCVVGLRSMETTLPNLMQQLMQSTVKVADAEEPQYRKAGVVEDVTMCGIRQRQGTVGYVGLCSVMFYVVVRIDGSLRRYRIDQLELVQSSKERVH